jgi:hypothetical protein
VELIERFQQLATLLGQSHEYRARPADRWDVCEYRTRCNKQFGACMFSCQTCGRHNQIRFCVIEDYLIKRFCDQVCAELWVDLRLFLRSRPNWRKFNETVQQPIDEAWRKGDPEAVKKALRLVIGKAEPANAPSE